MFNLRKIKDVNNSNECQHLVIVVLRTFTEWKSGYVDYSGK